ncbi:MAG: hypothetical protein ACREJX_11515, partial [Polyangiaceae bacterium]
VPRAVWTRVRSARLPLGLALAAAVVAFLVLQSRPSPPDLIARARAKDDGAEMFLGLAPVQREPVALAAGDNATSAIERVPTSRADVAFYWIGSTRENP